MAQDSSRRHFAQLLGCCHHRIHSRMDERLRPYDISSVQCRTLVYLHDSPQRANQRALERFLMVKPSTVNGIVCRLEEKGLVQRSADARDARCRYLSLTEQGKRFYDDFYCIVDEITAQLERGFSAEELDMLTSLLRRISNNMRSEEETPC